MEFPQPSIFLCFSAPSAPRAYKWLHLFLYVRWTKNSFFHMALSQPFHLGSIALCANKISTERLFNFLHEMLIIARFLRPSTNNWTNLYTNLAIVSKTHQNSTVGSDTICLYLQPGELFELGTVSKDPSISRIRKLLSPAHFLFYCRYRFAVEEIDVDKLTRMWIAEGMVMTNRQPVWWVWPSTCSWLLHHSCSISSSQQSAIRCL